MTGGILRFIVLFPYHLSLCLSSPNPPENSLTSTITIPILDKIWTFHYFSIFQKYRFSFIFGLHRDSYIKIKS